jgi:hypothetical protein
VLKPLNRAKSTRTRAQLGWRLAVAICDEMPLRMSQGVWVSITSSMPKEIVARGREDRAGASQATSYSWGIAVDRRTKRG